MVPDRWTVCVTCFTYNQSLYITETMNGFAMQQTDFPFVCCIVDDASTDGEQNIVKDYIFNNFNLEEDATKRLEDKDYGTYIVARHKTNHNCYFLALFLKKNHYGSQELKQLKRNYISHWENSSQYIALCEGDDYWIDKNKLQKQVDFLSSNKDYSMCFHKVEIRYEKDRRISNIPFQQIKEGDYTAQNIMEKWTVPTCSVMFRKEVLANIPSNPKFQYNDNVMWLTCARVGKLRCIGDIMGVYRRPPDSYTSANSLKLGEKFAIHTIGLIESFPELSSSGILIQNFNHMFLIWIYNDLKINKIPIKSLKFAFKNIKYLRPKQIIKELKKYVFKRSSNN